MNVLAVFGNVILRALLAAAVSAVAIFFLVVSSVGSSSGKLGVTAGFFVAFFGGGWSLLPLVRESRLLTVMAALAWFYFGYAVHESPGNATNDGINLAWVLASVAIVVCLLVNRPKYLRGAAAPARGADLHEASGHPEVPINRE